MTERERQLEGEVARLRQLNAQLQEELYLARHRLFGRKSEAAVVRNLLLFDELPLGIVEKPTELQPHKPPAHKRAKKVGRKPLDPKLPRLEILLDLKEDEKQWAVVAPWSGLARKSASALPSCPDKPM